VDCLIACTGLRVAFWNAYRSAYWVVIKMQGFGIYGVQNIDHAWWVVGSIQRVMAMGVYRTRQQFRKVIGTRWMEVFDGALGRLPE
jgi:hypothetical protein